MILAAGRAALYNLKFYFRLIILKNMKSEKTVLLVCPGRTFISQEFTQPSLTVPGEAIPLRKVLESFSNGSYTDVRTHKVHFDGLDDFDSPLADIDRKDISEIHNLSLELLESSKKNKDFVEHHKRLAQLARKAESEKLSQEAKAERSKADASEGDTSSKNAVALKSK